MVRQIKKRDKKKSKLRNLEYYDLQENFDELYEKSKKKKEFKNLLPLIMSQENILLAYRNIKKNKGSKTPGVDPKNILIMGEEESLKLVERIQKRFQNYRPGKVRRKFIKKEYSGKMRPLGIPTIEDRIIQQCILQVLDPICEAKFHKHSYGFRNNRSTHHAIKRVDNLMFIGGMHYVVDIDIKGFFDNVNHEKLLKQMWTLGIRDKNLLCIIGKMLKAEIKGEGIPTKGTPQGGILSPLLSNIVLNELDWWVSNQYETNHELKAKRDTKYSKIGEPYTTRGGRYSALRQTKLKQIFIVRYADDFKIFCKDAKTAQKTFVAVKNWLKERLGLEISPEKSKVTNLRKNYTEFLGFKLKVQYKRNKAIVQSHISDKAKRKIIENLKTKVDKIAKNASVNEVNKFNSTVLGIHNYYEIATRVNIDFHWIAFVVNKYLRQKLLKFAKSKGIKSKTFLEKYGEYNFKTYYIHKVAMFPILGVKFRIPYAFKQEMCNYTYEGRKLIHKYLQKVDYDVLRYIMKNPVESRSAEFNDNRISLYSGQIGKCGISKKKLEIDNMEVHHKIPVSKGGKDNYENLIFVRKDIHKLIHAVKEEIINKYKELAKVEEKEIKKINKLRKLLELEPILI